MLLVKIEKGSVKTEPISPADILDTIPVTNKNKE